MMDQFTECHNRYTRGYLDWGAERRLHLQNNGNVKRNMMNVFCKVSNPATTSTLGRLKNAFSSETDKIMLGTTFSHYLGIKQCRKPKIENFYTFFHPVQALRSFTT